MLTLSQPEDAKRLLAQAQGDIRVRQQYYRQLATLDYSSGKEE